MAWYDDYKNKLANALVNYTQTPSKQLSQVTSPIYNYYQEKVPSHLRMYGESLAKSLTNNLDIPATEKNFSPEELGMLKKIVQSDYEYKKQQHPNRDDYAFNYGGYTTDMYSKDLQQGTPEEQAIEQKLNSLRNTLGRFRYKVNPNNNEFNIYDTYDFNNGDRENRVLEYSQMSPSQRAYKSISEFLGGDDAALGEAYLGLKGVPVNIKLK
jgi:hypothetical protein